MLFYRIKKRERNLKTDSFLQLQIQYYLLFQNKWMEIILGAYWGEGVEKNIQSDMQIFKCVNKVMMELIKPFGRHAPFTETASRTNVSVCTHD